MRERLNTVSMLGQAYSLLGFQIVDGVVGAGYPRKPSTLWSSPRCRSTVTHDVPGAPEKPDPSADP